MVRLTGDTRGETPNGSRAVGSTSPALKIGESRFRLLAHLATSGILSVTFCSWLPPNYGELPFSWPGMPFAPRACACEVDKAP